MKTKAFLTVIALLACTAVLNGQYAGRRVSYAISLQPHISWMHADELFTEKGPIRMGIESGLRVDYRFQRSFAFSFGLNLNHTGGNITYTDGLRLDLADGIDTVEPGTRVTYRLQYVEIPLALKLILPEIGYSTYFAEFGIDPMFNSRAFINATDNNIHKEPFKQGIGNVNLAWHTGAGLNYSLGGRLSLQFALIYKNTFLDVTRENNIRKADNVRINEIGLRIGLVL